MRKQTKKAIEKLYQYAKSGQDLTGIKLVVDKKELEEVTEYISRVYPSLEITVTSND